MATTAASNGEIAPPAQGAPSKSKSGLLATGQKVGMTGFKATKGVCDGFIDFLTRANVIELAVAFVVAQATVALVQAIVRDIITPLLAAIWGQPDFSRLKFTVNSSTFMYGDLINNALSFLIMLIACYFIFVLPMNAVQRRVFPKPDMRKCPECLSEIDAKAVRCKFCTVAVPPVAVVVVGKEVVDAETGATVGSFKGNCCSKKPATIEH